MEPLSIRARGDGPRPPRRLERERFRSGRVRRERFDRGDTGHGHRAVEREVYLAFRRRLDILDPVATRQQVNTLVGRPEQVAAGFALRRVSPGDEDVDVLEDGRTFGASPDLRERVV